MAEPLVVRLAAEFRERLAERDSSLTGEMARRWLSVEAALQAEMLALAEQVADRQAAGLPIGQSQLFRLERYQSLLAQVQEQLTRFDAVSQIDRAVVANVLAGLDESVGLIEASAGTVAIRFDRLGVEAAENITAIARAGKPLNQILERAYPLAAEAITDRLITGVASGINPREVARRMVRDGLSQGLSHILLVARDQANRSYREASRQQYMTSGVVTKYRRIAAKQPGRTCLACLALDGTEYDVGELMELHPQDRCAMIPIVRGIEPPQWAAGEAYFNSLPEGVQRDWMGPERHELWKAAQLKFRDMAKVEQNSTWGPSVRVRPVKGLTTATPQKRQRVIKNPGEFLSSSEAKAWLKTQPKVDWDFKGTDDIAEINEILGLMARVSKEHDTHLDMVGVDARMVRGTVEQYDKLAKQWPEVAKRLEYLGTYRSSKTYKYDWRKSPNAWAHAYMRGDWTGKVIGLNPRWYGNPEEFERAMRKAAEVGFHPAGCDTVESVLAHEFGHMVDAWLKSQRHKAFLDVIPADGFGLVADTLEMWRIANRPTKSLSTYALSNPLEAFAEGFAAIYHTPKGKRPVFVKRLETLLKTIANPEGWVDLEKVSFYNDIRDEGERNRVRRGWEKLRAKLNLL